MTLKHSRGKARGEKVLRDKELELQIYIYDGFRKKNLKRKYK